MDEREPPVDAPRRRPGWGPIGLVLAIMFLVGAVGYLVGVRTTEPRLGAVDRGFAIDMSDHHDQAVLMAQYELANGSDPVVLDFAREIILRQRDELGQMAMVLAQHEVARPDLDLDRRVMAWMGMNTTVGTMPGWAQPDDLEALRTSRGTNADVRFLELMQAHHAGGVHMAEDAAEHADEPALAALADRMARYQRVEINEYQRELDRLRGAASPA